MLNTLSYCSFNISTSLLTPLKGILSVTLIICFNRQRRIGIKAVESSCHAISLLTAQRHLSRLLSFESCFAWQDHNLPTTTITCHRRLVLLMAERQKKPRLIQRHFSGIGFIMNGSLECRATGKTIFTNTITLAIIQPSHQYFCEPQP